MVNSVIITFGWGKWRTVFRLAKNYQLLKDLSVWSFIIIIIIADVLLSFFFFAFFFFFFFFFSFFFKTQDFLTHLTVVQPLHKPKTQYEVLHTFSLRRKNNHKFHERQQSSDSQCSWFCHYQCHNHHRCTEPLHGATARWQTCKERRQPMRPASPCESLISFTSLIDSRPSSEDYTSKGREGRGADWKGTKKNICTGISKYWFRLMRTTEYRTIGPLLFWLKVGRGEGLQLKHE